MTNQEKWFIGKRFWFSLKKVHIKLRQTFFAYAGKKFNNLLQLKNVLHFLLTLLKNSPLRIVEDKPVLYVDIILLLAKFLYIILLIKNRYQQLFYR